MPARWNRPEASLKPRHFDPRFRKLVEGLTEEEKTRPGWGFETEDGYKEWHDEAWTPEAEEQAQARLAAWRKKPR
jgi:hypothetical protein